MSDLTPMRDMSDLAADDLLLDRLGARGEAGSEPVAGLLAALAAHADRPLPARPARRRRKAHRHRYLGAFAAVAIAASGAGVAAAVTLPHHGPGSEERARTAKQVQAAARREAPRALLPRLGLPRTTGTAAAGAKSLVLTRRSDGAIVLLPAALAAATLPAADEKAGPGADDAHHSDGEQGRSDLARSDDHEGRADVEPGTGRSAAPGPAHQGEGSAAAAPGRSAKPPSGDAAKTPTAGTQGAPSSAGKKAGATRGKGRSATATVTGHPAPSAGATGRSSRT
ncbi:hypothetical protein [Terrabacter sp. BE26]|uniref:hypothetical protein n=1 Tax=Terrabacter sp. BE26 TaxID=2898152 RepID=UPI0035BE48F9